MRGLSPSAWPLISGITSGTSGSPRNADELSTQTVPAADAGGITSRETEAPAENSARSTPRKASTDSVPTATFSPRNRRGTPSERDDANGSSSSTGNDRSSSIATISRPTAPVAPTTATRMSSSYRRLERFRGGSVLLARRGLVGQPEARVQRPYRPGRVLGPD